MNTSEFCLQAPMCTFILKNTSIVSPAMDCPVQCVARLSPDDRWRKTPATTTLQRIGGIDNGWMDGLF